MIFVAERLQHRQLGRPIGQLADGVVDLHFHATAMRRVDIRTHRAGFEKRIVDPRIDRRGVMDIHHVRAVGLDRSQVVVLVEITLGEMFGGVDRLERRHAHDEVEVQRLAGGHAAGAAECRNLIVFLVAHEPDASATIVTPRGRHLQRLLVIEVGIERPPVIFIAQMKFQPGVHGTDPRAVLIVLDVPLPVELSRRFATLPAQTKFVLRNLMMQRNFQSDVLDRRRIDGRNGDVVTQGAVRFQRAAQISLQ